MSRYWPVKIEGGAFFYTRALAGRRSDLLGRVLINSALCPVRSESDRPAALRGVTLWANKRHRESRVASNTRRDCLFKAA
jgi:hypothetical protein